MDKPYLEIRTAAGRTQLLLSGRPVSIGRHSDNHIVVSDNLASRFHCVIELTPDGYLLRDLGASNGTLVNGRRVQSARINPGDVVTVGHTSLVLILPRGPSQDDANRTAVPGAGGGGGDEDLEPLDVTDLVDLDTPAEPAGGEELEELSEADIVEDDFDYADAPVPVVTDADDYEHVLRSLADGMPGRAFGASDIRLITPRGQEFGEESRTAGGGGPAQMVYLLRLLLLAALRGRATDLHLEPKGDAYQARFRVDGIMVDAVRLANEVGGRLAAVVKVLCELDPSQRNIIQEGSFSARVPGGPNQPFGTIRRVDFRVSYAPAVYGQKLVVRILDPATAPGRLADLGMPPEMEKELAWAVDQESGMVLVCGPTGSGKTSTLYALVRSLKLRERNVVTIEDPVEIQIEGATQIAVSEDKGNSFSALLRSVLRQDPDVILVGEIRDAETARIAMQASITGHLVFSTLHTKDSPGTVFRLLDLGVEPYLLAQGLSVVVAQRLVRQLCPACKEARAITSEQAARMGASAEGVTLTYVPRGCRRCLGTGYAGRRAFFELLVATESLRDAISRSPSSKEVSQALAESPFRRLSQAGFQLVAAGVVSFDEVEKAVGR